MAATLSLSTNQTIVHQNRISFLLVMSFSPLLIALIWLMVIASGVAQNALLTIRSCDAGSSAYVGVVNANIGCTSGSVTAWAEEYALCSITNGIVTASVTSSINPLKTGCNSTRGLSTTYFYKAAQGACAPWLTVTLQNGAVYSTFNSTVKVSVTCEQPTSHNAAD